MMKLLFQILTNQWTVTVAGGLIIAGLLKLASFIYGTTKSEKKVRDANQEVIDFLEKVITNKTELTDEFLQSIINSISRKNDVSLERMNSNVQMLEDVMIVLYKIDYLSIDEKNLMIAKLLEMKNSLSRPTVKEFSEVIKEITISDPKDEAKLRRDVIFKLVLEMVSLTALSISVLTILSALLKEKSFVTMDLFSSGKSNLLIISILIIALALVTCLLTLTIFMTTRETRKSKEKNKGKYFNSRYI